MAKINRPIVVEKDGITTIRLHKTTLDHLKMFGVCGEDLEDVLLNVMGALTGILAANYGIPTKEHGEIDGSIFLMWRLRRADMTRLGELYNG